MNPHRRHHRATVCKELNLELAIRSLQNGLSEKRFNGDRFAGSFVIRFGLLSVFELQKERKMKKNITSIDFVREYDNANSEERVKLIMLHYTEVPGVVKSSVEGLVYMVEEELDTLWKWERGELGVKVQSGKGPSDPTAMVAIRRTEIRETLIKCDFSSGLLDELESASVIKSNAATIKRIQKDYELFNSQLYILGPEKEIFEKYLKQKDLKRIAEEQDISYPSAKKKVYDLRCKVKASVIAFMDGMIGGAE